MRKWRRKRDEKRVRRNEETERRGTKEKGSRVNQMNRGQGKIGGEKAK